jgi:SET domain-containing protein
MSKRKWTAVEVVVRPSTIHGYGVFAKQRIAKHQLVATTNGAWLRPQREARRHWEAAPSARWRYWMAHYAYFHRDEVVFLRGPMKFVNHSCAPNIVWVNECCFALRDIEIDEELFENYRDFMLSTFHLFGNKCRCPACQQKEASNETSKPRSPAKRSRRSGKQRALGAAR